MLSALEHLLLVFPHPDEFFYLIIFVGGNKNLVYILKARFLAILATSLPSVLTLLLFS